MKPLETRLSSSPTFFILWAGLATFLAYFCMYLFRKPYTAGTYSELELFAVDYKIIIVIAQILGYALSKFIGIKVIAELNPDRRIRLFLFFILGSWLALIGFAITPAYLGPLWLFINGLPLGMIWGIVFTYCEGRKLTEVLTVFISVNFILSSGIAKSLGRWLIQMGIDERTMPMLIGLGVFPLLGLSLWMLSKIPAPSAAEVADKSARVPMRKKEKIHLLRQHWIPLILFILFYLVLTIIRDIRDNFAVEIWTDLGFSDNPEIFTQTELPVTLFILLSLGLLYKIRSNRKALLINVLISSFGIGLLLLTTFLNQVGVLSAIWWMIISGVGLFLPYILLNGIIFDRFIATYRIAGNVGFIMYMADATGYLGSVFILLIKNFSTLDLAWLPFYRGLCLYGGTIGLVISLLTYFYFLNNTKMVKH